MLMHAALMYTRLWKRIRNLWLSYLLSYSRGIAGHTPYAKPASLPVTLDYRVINGSTKKTLYKHTPKRNETAKSQKTTSGTMRTTDKLQDLMDCYYDVMSPALTYGEGRFLFDGGRVNGEKTPEDYDMVSGNNIDFFPDLMGA